VTSHAPRTSRLEPQKTQRKKIAARLRSSGRQRLGAIIPYRQGLIGNFGGNCRITRRKNICASVRYGRNSRATPLPKHHVLERLAEASFQCASPLQTGGCVGNEHALVPDFAITLTYDG